MQNMNAFAEKKNTKNNFCLNIFAVIVTKDQCLYVISKLVLKCQQHKCGTLLAGTS